MEYSRRLYKALRGISSSILYVTPVMHNLKPFANMFTDRFHVRILNASHCKLEASTVGQACLLEDVIRWVCVVVIFWTTILTYVLPSLSPMVAEALLYSEGKP